MLKICGRDREDLNFGFLQVTGVYTVKASAVCMQFSLLKHYNNGARSAGLQIGNAKSYFGRTLCSTSISAISKNMRRGDNISVAAINYEGGHSYIFIVEISIKLKDT